MANFYWVGNGGNWTDSAHWATSSGGAGGAGTPTVTDDTFIDANSFTSSGQTLNFLNDNSAVCRTLTISGVLNSPKLDGTLHIYRDLALGTGVDWSNYPLFIFAGPAIMTLTSNGVMWKGFISVFSDAGTGTLVLMDDLTFEDGDSGIEVGGATFDANDFDVTTGYFLASDFPSAATVHMRSGTWTVIGEDDAWEIVESEGFGVTINAGTSHIIFQLPDFSTTNFINDLTHDISYYDLTVVGSSEGFDEFTFAFDGEQFPVALTFRNVVFQNPSGELGVNFESGHTYNITSLTADGLSVAAPISFFSFTGSVFGDWSTLNVTTASVSNLAVLNNHLTGAVAPLTVQGSDLGGNDGWIFNLAISVSDTITIDDSAFPPYFTLASSFGSSSTFGSTGTSQQVSLALTPATDQVIGKVWLRSNRIGSPTDSVVMTIYLGGTNGENGTFVWSVEIPFSDFPTSASGAAYVPFTLPTPITLISGSTYFFTFSRTGAFDGSNCYQFSLTSTNQFANAVQWRKAGNGVWSQDGSGRELAVKIDAASSAVDVDILPPGTDIHISVFDHILVREATVPYGQAITINRFETITVTESVTRQVQTGLATAIESITVTESVTVQLVPGPGTTRYWVGGSGNWNDASHWAASSGGPGGASIPSGFGTDASDNLTAYFNVVFDANSFSSNGNTVTLDSNAYCLDFDVSGLDQTVTLAGSNVILRILGDTVTLSDKLTVNLTGDSTFWVCAIDRTTKKVDFTQNDATFTAGTLRIGPPGNVISEDEFPDLTEIEYNILDDINVPNSHLRVSTGVCLSILSGIHGNFHSNNHTITAQELTFAGAVDSFLSTGRTHANLGTSTVNISKFSISRADLNGSTSVFNFTPIVTGSTNFSRDSSTTTFNLGTLNIFKGTGVVATRWSGSIVISGTVTIEAGSTWHLESGSVGTQTYTIGNLVANGSTGNLITLNGMITGAVRSTLAVTTSSVSFVSVSNSIASPNVIDDQNGGVNGGNNTGWLFLTTINVHDVVYVDSVLPEDEKPDIFSPPLEISVFDRIIVRDRALFGRRHEIDASIKSISGTFTPVASD